MDAFNKWIQEKTKIVETQRKIIASNNFQIIRVPAQTYVGNFWNQKVGKS